MDFSQFVVGICRHIILFGTIGSSFNNVASNALRVDNGLYQSESSYFFYQQSEYPADCQEAHVQCSSGDSSGVYHIRPRGYPEPFEVYCDNTADSGGWTVIHNRRANGMIDFNRTWESYKQGFGFISLEFWIGNEKLSFLTSQKDYQLRIEMTTENGSSITVDYNNFRISDEFSNYKLINLSQFLGVGVDTIAWCPENMFPGNCTCGKRTCEDPSTCINSCVDGQPDSCALCPAGFYMKGYDCVSQSECGCYAEEDERIVAENDFFINHDCSRKHSCAGGVLTSTDYSCHADAVCDERDGVRRCYCNQGLSGDGEFCSRAADCQDLYSAGIHDNGVYSIKPTDWPGSSFDVFCNMSDGGGWTVFQRRVDGAVDFYLGWSSYKSGFGNLSHEFWLGNDKLYYLTKQGTYQLRIDMVNANGAPYYAKYASFRVSNEADDYRLSVGSYSGTAGYDSLAYHNGMAFTTKDNDNDRYSYNCAANPRSAWWYNNCDHSDLNANYFASSGSDNSIEWYNLPGGHYNLKFTEMKIRPA